MAFGGKEIAVKLGQNGWEPIRIRKPLNRCFIGNLGFVLIFMLLNSGMSLGI